MHIDDYRSDIPRDAVEEVLESYPSGVPKVCRYLVGDQVVGARAFFESGQLELETPRRNGVRHGTEYQWDEDGQLRSAIPYESGLEHGTARQWGPDGTLIGTYHMQHGTGVDLWRSITEDGSVYLSEARYLTGGQRDGVEWWINPDQRSVHREMFYSDGVEHGILREWEPDGRLGSGSPAFFILGEQVDRQEYLRRSRNDTSLPPYRDVDDNPQRHFPTEVAQYLQPTES